MELTRLFLILVCLWASTCFAQFEYLEKQDKPKATEVEILKAELDIARAMVESLSRENDSLKVNRELAAVESDSAEQQTPIDVIEVFVAKGFPCPPCEKWKKEQLPKVLEAGWKVHIEGSEIGPVPRFRIRGMETSKYLDDALMSEIVKIPMEMTALSTGSRRSSKWPAFRAECLKKHPTCEACGRDHNLAVHHVKPVHEFPEYELVEFLPDGTRQTVTLCCGDGDPKSNSHLKFGHDPDGPLGPLSPNWKLSNPNVLQDAQENLKKVKK